jgi:ATP-dependent Clp protease ATP-binding subunit ClpA
VEQARAEGCSWTDIGAPRGLSRQGAQQRYAPLIAQLTVDDLINAGMLRRFDDEALGCLRRAETHARRLDHDAVDSGDLLLAVLDAPAGVADNVIRALGADPADVRAALEERPDDGRPATEARPAATTLSSEARRVIDGTIAEAHGHVVMVAHLLLGLLRMPGSRAGRVLGAYGITKPAALAHLLRLAGRQVEDRT